MAMIRYRCRICGATTTRTELQGSPPPRKCTRKDENGNYREHEWERIG